MHSAYGCGCAVLPGSYSEFAAFAIEWVDLLFLLLFLLMGVRFCMQIHLKQMVSLLSRKK